jgi:hypothetical protein
MSARCMSQAPSESLSATTDCRRMTTSRIPSSMGRAIWGWPSHLFPGQKKCPQQPKTLSEGEGRQAGWHIPPASTFSGIFFTPAGRVRASSLQGAVPAKQAFHDWGLLARRIPRSEGPTDDHIARTSPRRHFASDLLCQASKALAGA